MFKSLIWGIARRGQREFPGRRLYSAASVSASSGVVARRAILLFPSAAAGFYAFTDEKGKRSAYAVAAIPLRLTRDVYCACITLLDYKLLSLRSLDGDALEYAKQECHQRGANRLLNLCFANGGIYIKLGQHIGMLDHLLPREYVLMMRNNLLDRCPVSSIDSVRATIKEDLGRNVDELFSEFDPEPIASASLAQVHVATDRGTGAKVAVKVQHAGLRETSSVDLATIEMLVRFVRFVAPSADYMWLVDEAKENLPMELDFMVEASNAERCARLVSSPGSRVRGRVVTPGIDRSKSSHRVLTMEYIQGIKVTDQKGLMQLGISPQAVARLISMVFADMIFKYGDVHADPHAANMLLRRAPSESGRSGQSWQLVLLDHGLYRRLDDRFRLEYAYLWRSLIFGDVPGIVKSASAMNAGDAVPLFAGMLTQRPWRDVAASRKGTERLQLQYTAEEREELQGYAGRYAKDIARLLARIPHELLLLLKTNDCLRAVDAELGAGVNNYIITARACSSALARHREKLHPGWRSRISSWKERVSLESRLALLSIAVWIEPIRRLLWGSEEIGDGQVGDDELFKTLNPGVA